MTLTAFLTEKLAAMPPGSGRWFPADLMAQVQAEADPGWSPEDWLLHGITMATYELSWRPSRAGGVIFERRAVPAPGLLRTWVAPRMREHFYQRPDGLWERKPTTELTPRKCL